jgi:SAM-dependent methyltransferase
MRHRGCVSSGSLGYEEYCARLWASYSHQTPNSGTSCAVCRSPTGACGVYCSHVLEHLARDDLALALRNTLRILRPGGIFRLVVPDLHWRAARYMDGITSGNQFAADQFMTTASLGRCTRPKGIISLAREYFGHSAHLWMYDFASLKARLEATGFVAIRRCDLGDARDRMFDLVEEAGRFFDHGERELAIEAQRSLH